MKEIHLTQGKVALVDEEDYSELSKYKWCAHRHDGGRWYAVRSIYHIGNKSATVAMQNAIIDKSSGLVIDHIDGNGLNNQKSNLRIVTIRGNSHNRHRSKIGGVTHSGVYFRKDTGGFRAGIWFDGKQHWLGTYGTETEAVSAYTSKFTELGCML